MRKKQYRSFESAKKFAQKLGLKNREEWQAYCKSGNNPDDIPASAGSIYKKDFKGWGDWLGSGNVKPGDIQSRSFKKSREFSRSLKLKGWKEWVEYCKSGNKPDDIPSHPNRTYKNKGWINWGDFLGSGTIASKDMKGEVFLSFKEARKFVRGLGLKDTPEWNEYRKSGNKPDDIPSTPNVVYKNEGWKSIPDWLGNGNLSNKYRIWLTFEECQKFTQKNNITSQIEWEKFGKLDKRPSNIPSHPDREFPKQWKGWPDFLGIDRVAHQYRKFKSFKDAKIFAISLNLKRQKDWQKYSQTNKRPKDMHAAPDIFYKKQGTWTNWGDFLGTGTIANQNKEYLPVEEAIPVYRKLCKEYGIVRGSDWPKFAKTHKKLLEELHIPADVLIFYSKEKAEKRLKK
jgi:hypothetical protein